MDRKACIAYISHTFHVQPDYPFEGDFSSAVFRCPENRRWFALLMEVSPDRLGLKGTEPVLILNIKTDPLLIGSLLKQEGFLPAYHMNKAHWITMLPQTAPEEMLRPLLAMSHALVSPSGKASKSDSTGQKSLRSRGYPCYSGYTKANTPPAVRKCFAHGPFLGVRAFYFRQNGKEIQNDPHRQRQSHHQR